MVDVVQEPVEETAARKHPRMQVVLLVASVVFVVAALLLGVVGVRSFADARSARSDAHRLTAQRHPLEAQQTRAKRQSDLVVSAGSSVGPALDLLGHQLDAESDVQNHLSQLEDQAVAQGDNGNVAAAKATFAGSVASTLADFEQKSAAARKALSDAQARVSELKEALHG
jgi:hypothetical protein